MRLPGTERAKLLLIIDEIKQVTVVSKNIVTTLFQYTGMSCRDDYCVKCNTLKFHPIGELK